jgi:hypothetical protein
MIPHGAGDRFCSIDGQPIPKADIIQSKKKSPTEDQEFAFGKKEYGKGDRTPFYGLRL